MSQYVARATGVAKQAAETFSKRVVPPAVDYYNATMARNAEYVVKDPAAVDKLGRQLVFSNLAKLPGMVGERPPAEVGLGERVGLDHGAHGPVEDQDAFAQCLQHRARGWFRPAVHISPPKRCSGSRRRRRRP